MDDPCLRKSTMPRPVLAPTKNKIKTSFDNSKGKSLLEKDLHLSDNENETTTSVNDLLALMVEEAVAETESEKKSDENVVESTSVNKLNETESEKNHEDGKQEKKLAKKRVLSKEFISDDEENGDPPRKSILISPKSKNQCRYVFVKKPRRGERCSNLTDTLFCSLHLKKEDKKECLDSNISLAHKQKEIRDLKLATQEISTKLDFLLNKQQENETKMKNKIQELEKTIGVLKMTNHHTKSQKDGIKIKIHKLNKRLAYKVLEFNGKREMKLEAEKKIIILTLPKVMKVPENCTEKTLKFNSLTKRFEFV